MNTPTDDQLNDFERALLPELTTHVALRARAEGATTSSQGRRRGARFGLVAAAVATATIGSVSLLSGGGAAYAVDTADDGAVTVRILDRSDAAGLEAALAEHGITAEVDYSGGSAVSVLEGPDGRPELVPTDDTPPPNQQPVLKDTPNIPTLSTYSSGDRACPGGDLAATTLRHGGDATSPIMVKRSGDGFVIKLTGDVVKEGADLQLAIFAGGHTEGVAGIYDAGNLMCGASTIWTSVR